MGLPLSKGKCPLNRWQCSPRGWKRLPGGVVFRHFTATYTHTHTEESEEPLVFRMFSSNCFSAVEIVIFSFSLFLNQLPTYSPPWPCQQHRCYQKITIALTVAAISLLMLFGESAFPSISRDSDEAGRVPSLSLWTGILSHCSWEPLGTSWDACRAELL